MWTILLFVSGNGKEEATLERSIKGHCDYKIMGPLITIKATYHVPFQTNTICGIGSNECSRYHIAVEDSNITGHSISPVCCLGVCCVGVCCLGVSRVSSFGISVSRVSVSFFVSVCHGLFSGALVLKSCSESVV